MKNSIMAILLFCGVSANAGNKMIDCEDVDNLMSWSVIISPDLKIASHNDNDHDTAMKRTDISFYDTMPTQTVYTFEGQDRKTKIKFTYTQETSTGTLFFKENIKKDKITKVKFNCKVTTRYNTNWNEVQEAIKNASSNGGSTRY